ncbi:probable 39S ribosomal protein L45, mitochondrial [Scaptodrosophila lebanonensis]|uniref:Large ribosomal subunit protein mL45 n=1 Tax=Drosophila lebanonensis TaxID=7225 RepID=A0A6J2T8S6_DROLE|nr:probable 39S ribosomal protein L45, mitochondrial [Scaptodrosophila lebanonensis]
MEKVVAVRNCLRFMQLVPQSAMLAPGVQTMQQVRHRQTKHWKPEFKRFRKLKFVKLDLPNLREKSEDISKEEMRSRMKERGVLPPRPWMERPFHISCTGGIFEAYVPPEGDGKKSIISTSGAKQKFEFLEKKSKSLMAVRKIRTYDESFSTDEFGAHAQEVYIAAHTHMAAKEKYKIREYVSERCYPEMMHNVKDKTIHWRFLQSLEPPRVVHARVTEVITKENQFAQVTVRFHTQQMLAIYDRFGRLMHGSEIVTKDVLEYVVFEKHISNEYGKWRLHDKIIPDWLPPKEPAPITYRLIEEADEEITQPKELGLAEPNKQLEAGTEQQQKEQLQVAATSSVSEEIERSGKPKLAI